MIAASTLTQNIIGTLGLGGLLALLALALTWLLLPWLLLARLGAIRAELEQTRRETVAKLSGLQQQLGQLNRQ